MTLNLNHEISVHVEGFQRDEFPERRVVRECLNDADVLIASLTYSTM